MGILDILEAGAQIDSYRIDEPIARSGMASIFRATDLRDNRVVALKVPHPDMEADPILFDRFHREAGIGERLNHPNVMRVYGGEKRSRIYMVMEWCPGRLLRNLYTFIPSHRWIKFLGRVMTNRMAFGLTIRFAAKRRYVALVMFATKHNGKRAIKTLWFRH